MVPEENDIFENGRIIGRYALIFHEVGLGLSLTIRGEREEKVLYLCCVIIIIMFFFNFKIS